MASLSSMQRQESPKKLTTICGLSSEAFGFTLIELLISLAIFAIGFLGLASLQHISIKLTQDTALQNKAISLSSTLIEQMRAQGGSMNLSAWQNRVQQELPQGQARLADLGDRYQLTMQWQESQYSEGPENQQDYAISFQLNP